MIDAYQVLRDLHAIRKRGYGRDLPGPFDAKFIELAEKYSRSSEAEREAIREAVHDESRLLLIGFSDRLAIAAERTQNPRLLFCAILAHSIEDFRYDDRENAVRLALVNHVAEKLGERPSKLFEAAAKLSSPRGAAALLAFSNRPPGLKSLRAMGIVEEQTDEGVNYRYS